VASSFSDVDKGYTARLRAIASMNGRVTSKVGVFGDDASELHDAESGLTNGELAAIHEFGAGVPERSFVRAWVDVDQSKITDQLKTEATDVAAGRRTIYKSMERFGDWAGLRIVARIAQHIAPALAAETVRRKGSDTPLVETGTLIRAIDSAVERNGKVLQ
jgi:hypothetical protein